MKRSAKLLATVVIPAAFLAACQSDTVGPNSSMKPQATVTIDNNGNGFVGKGDVQSAFGFANAALQKAVDKGITFSYQQGASQALNQSGSQGATQASNEALVCTKDGKKNSFFRAGTRTGTRNGSRNGQRAGTQAGTVGSDIDFTSRKNNQYDGFNLHGIQGTTFTASGDAAWGDWDSWTEWAWAADWSWGTWTAEDGSKPGTNDANLNACLLHTPGAYDTIEDVVTPGDVTIGDVVPGAVVPGAVTRSGAFMLFVTSGGVTKSLGSY